MDQSWLYHYSEKGINLSQSTWPQMGCPKKSGLPLSCTQYSIPSKYALYTI